MNLVESEPGSVRNPTSSAEVQAVRNTLVVPNERSQQLRDLAQRVVDALPLEVAEEVVVTGSVSRGVADEVSDIEMLIVTPEPIELAACFEHARAAGLEELDTWLARPFLSARP